jgi:hypothetical protein
LVFWFLVFWDDFIMISKDMSRKSFIVSWIVLLFSLSI